jgi:hypothetical protein
MYTQTEILTIARNCKTIQDVMTAAKAFRELIISQVQPSDSFIAYVFIKRFRELMELT